MGHLWLGKPISAIAIPCTQAEPQSVQKFASELQARLAHLSQHLDRDRERATQLEAELQNLTDVIAAGGAFSSVRAAIASREAELQAIHDRSRVSTRIDLADIRRFVTRSLGDLRGLLSKDVAAARTQLSRHVTKITMTPAGEGKNRYYTATGTWDLLPERECDIELVAGGGFEPPTFGL